MIYLDNAATTYPKPASVQNTVQIALKKYGANPGRAGHAMSLAAAEEIYRCRTAAADFFKAPGPECVAFTLNCTHAMNYVLKGLLKPGDHVVTSSLEHNAVMRPLQKLSENGVMFTVAKVFPGDNDATLNAFRNAIRENTKLIVCTHASNVWGIRLPVERIAALGHLYNIPIVVDCAQSAGVLPIDMAESGFDYLCVAGHKGLYGPMGTGMLVTPNGSNLETIIEGGTGTSSSSMEQPQTMPDRMESGTQNMPGIAGLLAGIEFVKSRGIPNIYRHEMSLIKYLYKKLSENKNIKLYTDEPDWPYFVPVLSFNVNDLPSETVSQKLNAAGIAVRAGLHCSPAAHESMGTLKQGTVRVSPSAFTTMNEMNALVAAVHKII
ncbi:aminotransferase class V-fold PLP-dependent enzyme [Caproiciproducens galactitolivorans]|uniref:cysteine desulfurase n=1 Tax=Caproiciproducens galactitolivorans TaxID=642589 RepID=A0A4Z0Y4L4_9FIRM|nr:aminotransferase class V-fold PLP-dependent enzyme [Caproiciproducens galactitolivorans]QEY34410.1 aminotransferase class V-fold PLP-dependent enzyme [Caproiciproducens galactitolivorans]TGJ77817.1 cysteine desulfurase SufS [Caproiciproducens galactitolivorans]